MASILKVNTIQDATNSNTAMTIDSTGRAVRPQLPYVAVQSTDGARFGTNHSSTTYDISYLSPLPLFADSVRTTIANQGGGTLTFHDYASSKYAKYVVPVTGIYEYSFYGGLRLYSDQAGDWVAMGVNINNVTIASSGNMDRRVSVIQVYNPQDAVDDVQANMSFTIPLSLNANDYIVPMQQSTGDSAFADTALCGFSLKLIG
tara:strand:+ start:1288 stop:1896 length:609 start_codon:yes stop_codon:yes gene_type:complete